MKRILWLTLAAAAVILFHGCKETGFEEPGGNSDGTVTFIIGNDSAETKSPVKAASYDLESDGLSIVETVSGMDSPGTKGTPVYTENFDSLYGSSLYATAYVPVSGTGPLTDVWGSFLENGGTVPFKNCGTNTYSYNYSAGSKNLHWPSGNVLHYFLQAPYSATSALKPVFFADGHIEFDYTDPVAAVAVGDRKVITDPAASQSDLLFTSRKVSKPETSSVTEKLLMYHSLTAVKFKAGNQDDEVETIIKKVTFKGIKANGHCTIRPNYSDSNMSPDNSSNHGGAASSKSSSCTSWAKHSTADDLVVDYVQTFSGTVDYDRENSSFGDSFYNGTNLRNVGAADGSQILLMVPQELKDVVLEVEYTLRKKGSSSGTDYKKSVKMSSVWKAGEIHTYTLTVNTVAVRIDDSMNASGTVKSNVETKNTGNVTAYLRATYTIAWYYGTGNDAVAVSPYSNNGTFVNLGGKKSGEDTWILGSDGYYYYRYPVQPGNSSKNKIFESFTAPSEAAPFVGAHLEMKVLLQGVQYDAQKSNVTFAWGNVHTVDASGKPTSTTVVSQLSDIPE